MTGNSGVTHHKMAGLLASGIAVAEGNYNYWTNYILLETIITALHAKMFPRAVDTLHNWLRKTGRCKQLQWIMQYLTWKALGYPAIWFLQIILVWTAVQGTKLLDLFQLTPKVFLSLSDLIQQYTIWHQFASYPIKSIQCFVVVLRCQPLNWFGPVKVFVLDLTLLSHPKCTK